MISARIGWVTRQGLAATCARLPRAVVTSLVALLFVANTVNIAADLAAMGEAPQPGRRRARRCSLRCFGARCLAAEVFVPYHRYAGS